jgi:hypothetical protein
VLDKATNIASASQAEPFYSVPRIFDTERSLQIITHVSNHIAASHHTKMREEYFFDLRPSLLERQKYNQEEEEEERSIAKSGYPNIIHFPSLLSYRRWSLCRRTHVSSIIIIIFVRTIASYECVPFKNKLSRLFVSSIRVATLNHSSSSRLSRQLQSEHALRQPLRVNT